MKKKIIMAKIQDTIHSLLYISLSPNCTVSVVIFRMYIFTFQK